MKWIVGLGVGLVVFAGVVIGVGMFLPEKHRSAVTKARLVLNSM